MSDKKRTSVTIIETHEVWIIRRAVPELSEVEVLTPDGAAEPPQVSSLRELNNNPQTNEQSNEEQS